MPKLAPYEVRAQLISQWAKATPLEDLHQWVFGLVCRTKRDGALVMAHKVRSI